MEEKIWETQIIEDKVNILKRIHLIGNICWFFIFFFGFLILLPIFNPPALDGKVIIFFILLLIFFPFYYFFLFSRKISIWIILLLSLPCMGLLFSFSQSIALQPLFNFFDSKVIPPIVIFSIIMAAFVFVANLLSGRSLITAPFSQIIVYKSKITVGPVEIIFGIDPLKIHTGEKNLLSTDKNFYVVKFLVNYMQGVVVPTLVGGLLSGNKNTVASCAGSGIILGNYQRTRKMKILNISVPLNKEQLTGFLSSLNSIDADVFIEDWSRGSSPLITNSVQSHTLKKMKPIVVEVFKKTLVGL
ncbi:hypothetical protein KKA09_01145 [Patescibacteria group bacterium]|nr:hypothetical protein [Patescibacteria group bacterium]